MSEHQHRVFNTVLNMVQNLHDAEEITQDVFVDVYKQPDAYRGEAAVSTWLYRIAMNKCIDHLRGRQRRKWSIAGFFAGKPREEREFNHPGVAAENRENAAIVFKAMKQLQSKQYAAWVLSEMEDLSYKEISEIMNVSVSSVESLLFRARKNLKKILEKEI